VESLRHLFAHCRRDTRNRRSCVEVQDRFREVHFWKRSLLGLTSGGGEFLTLAKPGITIRVLRHLIHWEIHPVFHIFR
jgi:hypothetical protein